METVDKIHSVLEKAECLYSFDEINQALDRMAKEISLKLKNANPLILCVMTGALIPTGHIATRLHFPVEIDYLHVTRYRGTNRGGDLHWLVEPRKNLEGRTVLIIDDIMDGGLTLSAIIDYCNQAKAKAVYTAVMVSKKRTREPGVNFEPDFVGVETEDKYLFGFGLDYNEYLRNVPGIYAATDVD
ncbi:Hypoxanthine-guanine phosphoribosyltransferase [Aquicella siphonis]|uniref:Hypoxanthine-guanine phosphoribosyltransferase n=1 Tax=Aquicella siphonis TaxID=254247 RepID=A0A5E4PH92_9COXI|nr:hypoxanthine-guanine phosphoribosyltransferase [Aquicella siphonis]VVC75888.1 Hypoxanthine-guanine phosphoribosyltransferase [Aquicella siphonis]